MDWIPCSERLPERGSDGPKYSDDHPVTVETVHGPEFTRGYYCLMNGQWYRSSDDALLHGVIAWQPRKVRA